MRRPRIPKQHRFPWGYVVPTEFHNLVGLNGQTLLEQHPNGPRIDIDTRGSYSEQIEAYAHEMMHAAADFNRWVLQTIVAPLREEEEATRKALEEKHE